MILNSLLSIVFSRDRLRKQWLFPVVLFTLLLVQMLRRYRTRQAVRTGQYQRETSAVLGLKQVCSVQRGSRSDTTYAYNLSESRTDLTNNVKVEQICNSL